MPTCPDYYAVEEGEDVDWLRVFEEVQGWHWSKVLEKWGAENFFGVGDGRAETLDEQVARLEETFWEVVAPDSFDYEQDGGWIRAMLRMWIAHECIATLNAFVAAVNLAMDHIRDDRCEEFASHLLRSRRGE